jgi:hypothetical protein
MAEALQSITFFTGTKVHILIPEELLQRKAARWQKHYNLCRAIVDQVSVFVLLYQ